MAPGGVGPLAAMGSRDHGRPVRVATAPDAARLHRLRHQGSIQPHLGRPRAAQETTGPRDQACVRGIRRHLLQYLLSLRCEPAAVVQSPLVKPFVDYGTVNAVSGEAASEAAASREN